MRQRSPIRVSPLRPCRHSGQALLLSPGLAGSLRAICFIAPLTSIQPRLASSWRLMICLAMQSELVAEGGIRRRVPAWYRTSDYLKNVLLNIINLLGGEASHECTILIVCLDRRYPHPVLYHHRGTLKLQTRAPLRDTKATQARQDTAREASAPYIHDPVRKGGAF